MTVITSIQAVTLALFSFLIFMYFTMTFLLNNVINNLGYIANKRTFLFEKVNEEGFVAFPMAKGCGKFCHWLMIVFALLGLSANCISTYYAWLQLLDDPTLEGDETLVGALVGGYVLAIVFYGTLFFWIKYPFSKKTWITALILVLESITVNFIYWFVLWWAGFIHLLTVFWVGYLFYFSWFIYRSDIFPEQKIVVTPSQKGGEGGKVKLEPSASSFN